MRIRAILSAAVLVWSAAACTGKPAPVKPRPTPPLGTVVGKAVASPLPFGAKPLWTSRAKGVPRYASGFGLHGDRVLVVSGPKGGAANLLSVMDAATGKTKWSVREWKPLRGGHGDTWSPLYDPAPQVVDRGGDWGVLVPTAQNHGSAQQAYGLALLSGEDGRVLWRRPLVAERSRADRRKSVYPDNVLADDQVAVVSLRPSSQSQTVAHARLTAVDMRTGKLLWTRSGLRLGGIAARFVIAAEWRDAAAVSFDGASAGTVAVLDAATGRTRWSLLDRMPTAWLAAFADGLLLVRGQQGGLLTAPVLLDLTTGGEVGRMPAPTGNCVHDESLIACEVMSPRSRLLTVSAGERRIKVSGGEPPDGVIDRVQEGRIYFSGAHTPLQETDPSGTSLAAGPLPAGLLGALSDRYAVVYSSVSEQYEVYSVG